MYKTVSYTQVGVGISTPVKFKCVGDMQALINVVVTGGLSAVLEYSLNGTDYVPLGGNSSITSTMDATLVFPVHSVRVRVVSGGGTAKLIVLHNGG